MLSLKQYMIEGNPLARLHKHAQEGRHYAVLSAHRPEGEATPEQNKARHAELKKKLTAQGYAHKEVEGHYEGSKEKSIMVHAKGTGDEHGKQLLPEHCRAVCADAHACAGDGAQSSRRRNRGWQC